MRPPVGRTMPTAITPSITTARAGRSPLLVSTSGVVVFRSTFLVVPSGAVSFDTLSTPLVALPSGVARTIWWKLDGHIVPCSLWPDPTVRAPPFRSLPLDLTHAFQPKASLCTLCVVWIGSWESE